MAGDILLPHLKNESAERSISKCYEHDVENVQPYAYATLAGTKGSLITGRCGMLIVLEVDSHQTRKLEK
jgi:hypothetical protein